MRSAAESRSNLGPTTTGFSGLPLANASRWAMNRLELYLSHLRCLIRLEIGTNEATLSEGGDRKTLDCWLCGGDNRIEIGVPGTLRILISFISASHCIVDGLPLEGAFRNKLLTIRQSAASSG